MEINKLFEKLYVKNAPTWALERDPDGSYKYHATQSAFLLFEQQQIEIESLKNQILSKHKNGYYIRDLRNPIGNCMKFWYQSGYGTKHKNFFWCETLEEAKKYKGGCDWFEIWHASYIDSLAEYTVDFQLADRAIGMVDFNTLEQKA